MINIIIINIYIYDEYDINTAQKGSLADSASSIGDLEILDSYYLYNFFYVS